MCKATKTLIAVLVAILVVSSIALAGCAAGSGSSSAGSSNAGSAAGADASAGAANKASFQQISQAEAIEMMDAETGYIILDVRTAEEFAEGHIPNAINIPVETIGAEPPAELADKDQLIMVYCRSGNRSVTASEKLVDLGYTNIVEFGGINTWPGEVVTD